METNEVERQLKERVFVGVFGGAFPPAQSDNDGPAFVLQPPEHIRQLWFQRVPNMPKAIEPVFPFRLPQFSLMCELQAGTIDEIVAAFRVSLEAAARRMVDPASPRASSYEIERPPHRDLGKALENAKAIGYRPGQALKRNFFSWGDVELEAAFDQMVACYAKFREVSQRQAIDWYDSDHVTGKQEPSS